MLCEICKTQMNLVWEFEKSVIPNIYYKAPNLESCAQRVFFCEACFYIKNEHDFSIDQIFANYKYRSPVNDQDQEALTFLKDKILQNRVKSIAEVGGNNGLFAEKLLMLCPDIKSYDIWDQVPLEVQSSVIKCRSEYLSQESINSSVYDLVIVRHTFAHNSSINLFAQNIIQKLNPKFLYIECADWTLTLKNSDFSQLYVEHYYCLSRKCITKLFANYGFSELSSCSVPIHNGSFGSFLHQGVKNGELGKLVKSNIVAQKIKNWCNDCKDFYEEFIFGKKYIIWGCSAKIVFLLNMLEVDFNHGLVKIIDSTPSKKGFFPPGFSISVSSEPDIDNWNECDVLLIGARNFSNEIIKKASVGYPISKLLVPPF